MRPFGRLIAGAVCAIALVGCGDQVDAGHVLTADAEDQLDDGCARADDPIEEATVSKDGNPSDPQPPIDAKPVSDQDREESGAPAVLSGLPAQRFAHWYDGVGTVYYFGDSDFNGLTAAEFIAKGGIVFNYHPLDGQPLHEEVAELFPDRALAVAIGTYEGVLGWGDPLVNGVRAHNVMWADTKFNYRVSADRSPNDILNATREFVCQQ